MFNTAEQKVVAIGDVSIAIKSPNNPELVPIKYSQCFL